MTASSTQIVVLAGFPIALFQESREHNEALLREFAFIVESDDPVSDVPARLVTLGREMRDRFFGLNGSFEELLETASAQGQPTVDLEVRVPAEAREAALMLGALLDEADAFCRNGLLLTLTETSEVRSFRNWYIEECVRQLDGGSPRSWSAWLSRRVTTRS